MPRHRRARSTRARELERARRRALRRADERDRRRCAIRDEAHGLARLERDEAPACRHRRDQLAVRAIQRDARHADDVLDLLDRDAPSRRACSRSIARSMRPVRTRRRGGSSSMTSMPVRAMQHRIEHAAVVRARFDRIAVRQLALAEQIAQRLLARLGEHGREASRRPRASTARPMISLDVRARDHDREIMLGEREQRPCPWICAGSHSVDVIREAFGVFSRARQRNSRRESRYACDRGRGAHLRPLPCDESARRRRDGRGLRSDRRRARSRGRDQDAAHATAARCSSTIASATRRARSRKLSHPNIVAASSTSTSPRRRRTS